MTNTHIANSNNQATGLSTLAVSPATVGNVIILDIFASSFLGTVTSVTGGGCTWTFGHSGNSSTSHYETWFGVVNATGPATITVTYSGSVTHACELNADEYNSDVGTAWTLIDGNFIVGTATTTPTGPSVTATANGQIVADYFRGSSLSAGSTPGFNYEITANGGGVAYNLNSATGTAYTPSMNSTNATYAAIAIIVDPGGSGPVIGTAILSGTGTLSTVQIPEPIGTVALSGTGTLSTVQIPEPIGTVALSGTGTLIAVSATAFVALSGTGTLIAHGFVPSTGGFMHIRSRHTSWLNRSGLRRIG